MRIEFGNNRAICLREEDFIEIELSGDRITYSRPNGQKVVVSLRSVWVSESKIEVNQKPYLLGLPGNLDPQKPLHGIPFSENIATKDPSVCSEPLHPNSVRGPTEDLNSKFGQPIAKSLEESLEKLKNNLEFVKIELHEELEALKIQLQDSKEVLPASISLDDLVNETKIKVSEQINCWNDNQAKEIEQLKVRLTHFEEDSLTNRERFEKHLQQFADIEFEIIKVKDEKPTRRLSDVPTINEVWDKLMKEEEEYKKKHANDFDNYYDDFREEDESNFKYQKNTSHHRSKKKNKWT